MNRTPTYYTNALPSSSNSTVVVARPVETITLVPTTITGGQTFVISSTPTLKLAPASSTQVQQSSTTTTSPQKDEPVTTEEVSCYWRGTLLSPFQEYRKKMEDRRLRNRAAAQASRHRKRQVCYKIVVARLSVNQFSKWTQ